MDRKLTFDVKIKETIGNQHKTIDRLKNISLDCLLETLNKKYVKHTKKTGISIVDELDERFF